MIRPLAEASARPAPFDVCIVGTGPAGATVAAELRDSGLEVLVLESGGARVTNQGDALRETTSTGLWIKPWSRERVLGGASTTWAGLSSPLDDADLAPRPHLGGVGWPLPQAELEALWEEAAARYRFPRATAFGREGFGRLRRKGDLQPAWEELEEKVFLAAAEPQDFGREQRATWEHERVTLCLGATVTQLRAGPGGELERALVRDGSGALHEVRARAFVLACGGIENARLLLLSEGADGVALGNAHGQVGRCFMNHPKSYAGTLRFRTPVRSAPYYFGCIHEGFAGYAGLRLPTARQAELGLVNSYVRLEPLFPWSDNPGIEALVTLVKRMGAVMRAFRRSRADEVVELRDYAETGDDSEVQNARKSWLDWLRLAGTVLAHLPGVLHYLSYRITRRQAPIHRARIRAFMEMEPREENRVTLGEQRDLHGTPLPHVHHEVSARDRRSMVAVYEALERDLARTGMGTLEEPLTDADPWPIDQDASHHMGTTRMGTDPASSVTDPDLLVRGTTNLYAAGASVFPTSGCANPTFTIVALSIRLARTLRERLA